MNQLPEKDLPPGRHLLLKEHLMSEIRPEPQTRTRTRRSWQRPALLAGAVAAVTAVVLTFAVPSGGEARPDRPTSSRTTLTAAALLEDIALAAEHSDVPKDIRDDQFVYIESKVGWSGDGKLDAVHKREVWLSVDGDRAGLMYEPAVRAGYTPLEKDTPGIPSNTNYRNLQTLPTDPGRMYQWLHKVSGDGSANKDDADFVLVGDLARESLMPPAQAAALYRAAARIPGVFVVDDAVDAAGRHGIAVARVQDGRRTELIFDRKTKVFLGEREVSVKDGHVTGRSAVLERTVVDRKGERP